MIVIVTQSGRVTVTPPPSPSQIHKWMTKAWTDRPEIIAALCDFEVTMNGDFNALCYDVNTVEVGYMIHHNLKQVITILLIT